MKGLYFRVPTIESATHIVEELRINGVPENQIYVIGKDHYHLQMAHLHEAGVLQTTDLRQALIRGIIVGALAGLLVGIVLFLFPIEEFKDFKIGWGTIMALGVVGALFGAWGSTLVGISIPNPIVHQCERAIEAGELVIFLDIPVDSVKEVSALIKRHHPEALIESLAVKKQNKR